MIEALIGENELVARWVASQRPFNPEMGWGNYKAIGWVEDGVLIAGTVFNNWDTKAGIIEMSTAAQSPRWMTRPVLNTMFQYVFEACACQMVVMRVSDKNTQMCTIARRFGFADALIRRLYGKDEDGHVFTLTKEEWAAHRMRNTNG